MTKIEDLVRAKYCEQLKNFFSENGEDVAFITSNTLNMPIAFEGKEFELQIVVKIPKDDFTFEHREEYENKLKEKARIAEEKRLAKEKKIEQDKQRKLAKQKEKKI